MLRVEITAGSVRVRDRERPSAPGRGELLVEMRAAGLNGADMRPIRTPEQTAVLPGIEFAGIVRRIGPGAEEFAAGDRVMGLLPGGAQAQFLVAPAALCLPIPDELSWSEAGAFCETFTTAHDALFTSGRLAAGDRLLVQGAAGGVGTAAVQLGTVAGAHVVASVRQERLHGAMTELCPKALVVGPDGSTEAGPYDVVLELVGGPNLPTDLRVLNVHGRICVIGRGAGSEASIDLGDLMKRRAHILGSTLKDRDLVEKAEALRAAADAALPPIRRHDMTIPVSATFPLGEAPAAYEQFLAGGKFGKIVLTNE